MPHLHVSLAPVAPKALNRPAEGGESSQGVPTPQKTIASLDPLD